MAFGPKRPEDAVDLLCEFCQAPYGWKTEDQSYEWCHSSSPCKNEMRRLLDLYAGQLKAVREFMIDLEKTNTLVSMWVAEQLNTLIGEI